MSPDAAYAPDSHYGQSKMEAEQSLARFAESESISLNIARPPLVYGARAKANFGLLLNAARRGLPLPLGDAARSMVAIDNLVDALIWLAQPTDRGGSILLPADPEDLSVRELYRQLCLVSGTRPPSLPAPAGLIRPVLAGLGRGSLFDSLFRPALIDRSHWMALGWNPPIEAGEGLARATRIG